MLSAFVQTVSDGCSVDSETPEDFENATLASYTFWFQLLGLFPQETKNYPGKRPKQCGGAKGYETSGCDDNDDNDDDDDDDDDDDEDTQMST